MQELDEVVINFNSQGLWVLNIALAVIMFGVALNITIKDFKQLLNQPKPVLVGILSQFFFITSFNFYIGKYFTAQTKYCIGNDDGCRLSWGKYIQFFYAFGKRKHGIIC